MMKPNSLAIPAVWMRGGTSKGLFFHGHDLPNDPVQRDQLLLRAIGSPDPYGRQINGVGGATSSTSKIVIITPHAGSDADVNYCFGHVAIREAKIDYSGNCGNLASAVGVFAIEQGLVQGKPNDITCVRVFQQNQGKHMRVYVPTDEEGKVVTQGDYEIAGVPGSGSQIKVEFVDVGGAKNSSVLPTGNVIDQLETQNGKQIQVSLVNAGNPTVFIAAESLGLSGTELPDQINADTELLKLVEELRCKAAIKIGLADSVAQARQQPATPKLAFVSAPQEYTNTQNQKVPATDIDLEVRIFSMGKLHHALTGTGAIALAVAANLPGTLVEGGCKKPRSSNLIRLGHCAGVMHAEAKVVKRDDYWIAPSACYSRTARTLMRGEVLTA